MIIQKPKTIISNSTNQKRIYINKPSESSKVNLPETELKTARTEHINYALAHCPYCNAEHDVSTCGSGTITCVCEKDFYWSTED